jgi:hypothetical protein
MLTVTGRSSPRAEALADRAPKSAARREKVKGFKNISFNKKLPHHSAL